VLPRRRLRVPPTDVEIERALLRRLAGSADAGEQLRGGVRGLLALVVES
jgi:hypothetical protein